MNKAIFFIALLFLISFSSASPVIFQESPGISGQILKIFVLDFGSEKLILASTSTGLFVIDKNGALINSFPVPYSITDVVKIDDVNSDSYNDLVISTTDQNFPNIIALSLKDGKKLWEFKPEIPAYDSQMMWINKETKTWDLEVANDLNQDGKKDILAASGSILYLLNEKTGNPLWNFSATNDIWNVKYSNGLIILGTQEGIVYALNNEGRLIWENSLVQPYKVVDPSSKRDIGTVKRSVWDIIIWDNSIILSAEDGYIHLLDKKTGKVMKSKKIIDYDENLLNNYYGQDSNSLFPTGPNNDNFFNIQIQELDKDKIALTTFLGSSTGNNKEKGSYGATIRKLIVLDKNSLDEIQQTSEISLTDSKQIFSKLNTLFIPIGKDGSTDVVKSFGLDGTIKSYFINSTISSNNNGKESTSFYFAEAFDNSGFVLASDEGDLLLVNYNQSVRWSYPRYQGLSTDALDINNDKIQDYLIKSVQKESPDDPLEEGKIRMIALLDGKTQKIIWTYNLSYDDYVLNGGIQGEKMIRDTDGDGYSEIMGYFQLPGDWNHGDIYGEFTRLVLISGRTGEEIWRNSVINKTYYGSNEELLTNPNYASEQLDKLDKRISILQQEDDPDKQAIENVRQEKQQLENQINETFSRQNDFMINKRIISIDEIDDQNTDRINDILVSCPNEIYALSGKDASIIWFKTRDSSKYRSPLDNPSSSNAPAWNFMNEGGEYIFRVLGDINADGKQDFVAITNEKILLILSNESDYSVNWTWKPKESNFDSRRVKLLDDINGDRIKDIMLSVDSKGNKGSYIIIDGKTGNLIMSLSRDATAVKWNVADLNGDRVKDSIIFKKWSNDGPTIEVISGEDSSILYSYHGIDDTYILDQNGYSNVMPASYTEDLNGDGVSDLVIAKTSMAYQEANIVFVDVKNKKEIDKITLGQDSQGKNCNRYQPAISVSKIGTKESGANEVAIAGVFINDYGQEQTKVLVYDISKKRLLYEYLLPAAQIYNSGEKDIIITGKSGNAFIMNGSWSNPILEPKNDAKLKNILNLKWNSVPDSVYTILVNGQEVKKLDSNEASLNLKNGVHQIALKTEDRFGNSYYDYLQIDMDRNRTATLLINILIFLVISSLVGYNIYIHKKKEVK